MMLLQFLAGAAFTVHLTWIWAGCAINLCRTFDRKPPEITRIVWQELRPFYLAAVSVEVAHEVASGEFSGWLDPASAALAYFAWYLLKDIDDPDDRWKRRKAKLVERIGLVGGRLKVVPVATR